METRKNDQYVRMLLGTIPSPKNSSFTGSKLPSKRQVLLCFLSNLKENGRKSALSTTIDNVEKHVSKSLNDNIKNLFR